MLLKLIIFFLLYLINNAINFCHSLCQFNNCNGVLSSDCNVCLSGFYSPGTCIINPAMTYKEIGMVNGFVGLSTNPMFISPSIVNPFNCGGGQSFYQYYNTGQIVTVSVNSPALNYYKLRLRFSIITIDSWDITSKVKILFTAGTVQQLQYQSLQNDTIATQCEDKCQNVAPQCYKIVNYEFYYSSPAVNTLLQFQISAQFNSQYNPWSLRQLFLLARKCHPNCQTCFGDLTTQCTSCISGQQLSNMTCDINCLTYYGQNGTTVCMKCEQNCTNCITRPRICLFCIANHYLFTYGVDVLCVPQCPNGTYQTGTSCNTCISNCDICSTSSICISCQAGYYLQPTGNSCLATCPINFTLDSFNWTCQQCVNSCSSKFKCAQGYFLKVNVCVDTCPSYYIPSLRQCTASCPTNFYLNKLNNNCQPCIQGCAYCLTSTYCILWSNISANPQNQLWDEYLPFWIAIIIAGTIILIITIYCLIRFYLETRKKKPQRRQNFSQFNQTMNTGNNLTIQAFQSNKKLKITQSNKQFIQVKQPVIESFGVY